MRVVLDPFSYTFYVGFVLPYAIVDVIKPLTLSAEKMSD
jgi:hypothetical protein